MDVANIAYNLCDIFIYKSSRRNKDLTKDELLTYNSALRMLKAVMDGITDSTYVKNEDKDNPLDTGVSV